MCYKYAVLMFNSTGASPPPLQAMLRSYTSVKEGRATPCSQGASPRKAATRLSKTQRGSTDVMPRAGRERKLAVPGLALREGKRERKKGKKRRWGRARRVVKQAWPGEISCSAQEQAERNEGSPDAHLAPLQARFPWAAFRRTHGTLKARKELNLSLPRRHFGVLPPQLGGNLPGSLLLVTAL
ncbi:Hypothetical predicted protein [Podarcis lilfordi]|uniref:Uncharacterized protein n=1 Tax=Podarcis lilfordi TaxID=74358 RepID=A0AA35K9V8_9SAUR|nr:Hypothetical predicted protein [Podarcis lilfordi]